MKPGGEEQTDEGNVSAWLKDGAVPSWANDKSLKSEQGEDGSITNIVKKDDNTYTKTVTKPDGTVTVETVTLKKDEQGHVTGYTKTTETTGSVTDETVKPEVPDQATVGKDGDTTYSFELPEKPEITNPVQRAADGKPVSGEEVLPLIDTRGNVIGYTKVTYDNGEASFSDPVLGAYYATTTKIETLENGLQKITTTKTRVTDTEVLKEALSVDDGKWSLSGWMGDVTEGTDNGKLSYKTPKPDDEQFEKMRNWEENLGELRSAGTLDDSAPKSGELKYVGYGLYSNILLGYWKGNDFKRANYVHQFKLVDADGHEYYAYCADWSTNAEINAKYELVNVLDASYIKDKTAREHLQAIAENGYWGTEKGVGSLAKVKKLVDEKYWNAITDGIALAVTQAALWKYGNQDPDLKFGGNNMNGHGNDDQKYETAELLEFFYGSNATATDKNGKTYLSDIRTLTPAQREAAVELYNKLINLEPSDADDVTDIITKEDIKDATIRVKEKTKDGYNTDLSFTLTVDPNNINNGKTDGDGKDDVTLNIYVGGTLIKSHKLREAKNASEGSNTFTVSYDEETGKAIYTVNGLEFTSGADITLNLSGKQTLKGGAYLFRSDVDEEGKQKSQTFIGLITEGSTRDLDLSVKLGFHVVEPTITPKAEATSRDEHTVTWTTSYHTEWPRTPDQPEEPKTPETPETPETPKTPVTPVVPGYDVPKTGDASGLYYVLAIFSALGLALVTLTGRKRRTA